MAKLQKQMSRKVGDKIYPKYVLVVPPEAIKKAGFKEGDDLEIEAKKGKLFVKKS